MPPETQEQTTEQAETETTSTSQVQESEQESSEGTGLDFDEPDFGAITDFVDGNVEEEERPLPVAAEAEESEEPVEQEAAPQEEPTAPVESESKESPEETVKEEAEAPPEEPVVAKEEAPEPEPVKLPTREDLEGIYTEHREKTLPALEQAFTLSDEEAAALDEQPSKVLPKMAAQLQYDVMLSTYNAIVHALPTMMGTFNHATSLATKAENQFMDAWPDLDTPKAKPVVESAIKAYRSANPQASLEDTIKGAGVMAMINLGLDPTPRKKEETSVAQVTPKAAPPKPVAPTGANPVPPVKAKDDDNEFAQLAEVFLSEMS